MAPSPSGQTTDAAGKRVGLSDVASCTSGCKIQSSLISFQVTKGNKYGNRSIGKLFINTL